MEMNAMSESNQDVELRPHLQLELHNFAQGLPEMGREELMLIAKETFETLLYMHQSSSAEISNSRRRGESKRGRGRRRIAIYVVRTATSRLAASPASLIADMPKEILGFQTQFNCLREQKRVELLLLDRLNSFQVDSAVVESVERRVEWLENVLNQVLMNAVKWSYEHGYKFHSEPGGARFWVESSPSPEGRQPAPTKGGVA